MYRLSNIVFASSVAASSLAFVTMDFTRFWINVFALSTGSSFSASSWPMDRFSNSASKAPEATPPITACWSLPPLALMSFIAEDAAFPARIPPPTNGTPPPSAPAVTLSTPDMTVPYSSFPTVPIFCDTPPRMVSVASLGLRFSLGMLSPTAFMSTSCCKRSVPPSMDDPTEAADVIHGCTLDKAASSLCLSVFRCSICSRLAISFRMLSSF